MVAGPAEERADDRERRAEHEQHREQGDRDLAITGADARVAVDVGDGGEAHQDERRDHDA